MAAINFGDNPVFWTWAGFNTVQAFLPWNWGSENYYDYGTGGNIYYEGDTVYVGDTTMPAEEYADQAEEIATSAPKVENPDKVEWLPLGVFALTEDGNADAVPNMFLQLALEQGRDYWRHLSKQIDWANGIDRRNGRPKESACGHHDCWQEHADFGNWYCKFDQERDA